ncbi:nucleoside diphosphate kinase regulator [Pontibacter sp. 172403-2]|uniref:nucleoside diphosphate kinase regulator n=1 Tax=Pontibacter rufus TaxID=2791028 RepID=UPI0018AF5F3E|nr:nucleoside diphosphate kinase regulator [Pontibacter sp. 172403-2]MBF9252705.1 nucleoside diphosphate kinase regulator [Pontibacter sp. 172403-2]
MNTIYLTEKDHQRLHALVQAHRLSNGAHAVEALCKELKRAKVVASEEIPVDIVTMNSFVRLKELKSSSVMEITIVYPKDADLATRKISVLAPVATAVLGCKVGDEIEWPAPQGGIVTYKVEEILYQPEAAGDMYL